MKYGLTTFEGESYRLVNNAKLDKKISTEGIAYYVAPAVREGKNYWAYFKIIHSDVNDVAHACDWYNATYVEAI